MSILKKIKIISENKNDNFNDIAIYLLENINSLGKISIKTISNKLSRSLSSITRFCQSLGLSGFKSLIPLLEQENKNLSYNTISISLDDKLDKVIKKMHIQCTNIMENAFIKNSSILELVVSIIKKCKKIFLFGHSLDNDLLQHFANKLMILGYSVTFSYDVNTQFEYSKKITNNDFCLIINHDFSHNHILKVAKQVTNKTDNKAVITKNIADAFENGFKICFESPINETLMENFKSTSIFNICILEAIINALSISN